MKVEVIAEKFTIPNFFLKCLPSSHQHEPPKKSIKVTSLTFLCGFWL